MKRVRLTDAELWQAEQVAVARQASSVRKGSKDRHGANPERGLFLHQCGAPGELAFAKAMGWTWDGSVDTYKHPDVNGVQVRTRSAPWHDLIVRDDDADDEPFVLVLPSGPPGCYDVAGWIMGRDAKQDRWRMNHGGREPAYFVPKRFLQPLESLPAGVC